MHLKSFPGPDEGGQGWDDIRYLFQRFSLESRMAVCNLESLSGMGAGVDAIWTPGAQLAENEF